MGFFCYISIIQIRNNMKIQEDVQVTRTFVADDGTTFETEKECYEYEMTLAKKKIGESPKYVVGNILWNGEARFSKFQLRTYKTVPPKWFDMGDTYNVKYATKFDTFKEAYERGGNRVMTLEAAQEATDKRLERVAKEKIREQHYVCEYDRDPAESGEYITSRGMSTYDVNRGWSIKTGKPEFWMKKTKKGYN
jgi:hypothetical protein